MSVVLDQEEELQDIDFHSWSSEELQVLSPRRKVLVELEKILDVKIPATRKKHEGGDWRKGTPNIANEDLLAIAQGLFMKIDQSPQVTKELKSKVFRPSSSLKQIYELLASEEFLSSRELAEETGLSESTVRDYISELDTELDLQEEKVGIDGGGYRKKYRLPPSYRDLT
ncbi:MAG: HTH domain-containing protein [Candidatus Nanohaloarchaea archaeon]